MAKRGRRATNEERIRAVRLIESGVHYEEVARVMGVGESTILEWMRNYRAGGLAALSTKIASGRPTSLSDSQMLDLYTLIVGCEPRQLSFGFALCKYSANPCSRGVVYLSTCTGLVFLTGCPNTYCPVDAEARSAAGQAEV